MLDVVSKYVRNRNVESLVPRFVARCIRRFFVLFVRLLFFSCLVHVLGFYVFLFFTGLYIMHRRGWCMNAQEALAAVHGLWKRLLEACVGGGWAEACPLGFAPGGADEFGENALWI